MISHSHKNSNMAFIIGIDPGTKTGFAAWNSKDKCLEVVKTCSIVEAMATLLATEGVCKVRIEDARQRKWFGKATDARLQGVGSVKRDCAVWQEFCEYYGLVYELVHPKNINTKMKPAMFNKITGYEGKTSNHARDAAMMVYGL